MPNRPSPVLALTLGFKITKIRRRTGLIFLSLLSPPHALSLAKQESRFCSLVVIFALILKLVGNMPNEFMASKRVVTGGWTRDVHVVDAEAMTQLESRIRGEVEAEFEAKLTKAQAGAASASEKQKSLEELGSAMGELNELSAQAAVQVASAKQHAKQRKAEAQEARARAAEAEAAQAAALAQAKASEQVCVAARAAAVAAQEAEQLSITQSSKQAEAVAQRHAEQVEW